jgi:RNA polymerase sigma factor (sigma-70 family)
MSAVTKFKHGGAPFQSYAKLLIIGAIVDGVRALDGDCRYFSETRPRIIDVDIDHLTKPPQSDAAEYLDDLVAQLCPVDQTLVYYLRQGMTQAEIGRQLGVKQAAISIRIKVLIRKVRGLIEYSSFTD